MKAWAKALALTALVCCFVAILSGLIVGAIP
jgi:hypothetical protein